MQLSKRTQYGIRALICFADAYQRGYLQARELSQRENLPPKFLESILGALTRGKFLVSKIGAFGGYRLARPPQEITLADIIGRLEGKRFLDEAADEVDERTARPGELAIRLIQTRLTETVQKQLQKVTLSELTDQVAQQGTGQMYYI